ncbi:MULTISPECIES: hypothetical protein [unclassified Streptomyces]|nr:hypothetical protein [Streptomyces sp. NBC_01429]
MPVVTPHVVRGRRMVLGLFIAALLITVSTLLAVTLWLLSGLVG